MSFNLCKFILHLINIDNYLFDLVLSPQLRRSVDLFKFFGLNVDLTYSTWNPSHTAFHKDIVSLLVLLELQLNKLSIITAKPNCIHLQHLCPRQTVAEKNKELCPRQSHWHQIYILMDPSNQYKWIRSISTINQSFQTDKKRV